MKISLNLIKEFTEISIPTDELLAKLAAQLAEIEHVEDRSKWYEGIVIAEITEAGDHPNADKLGVYKVNAGQSDATQVCAGDKSLQVGDKVAYIPPGSTVPSSIQSGEPFEIGAREMRGEMSNGMLGSGAELCMTDNHEKVLVLDTAAEPGTPLAEAYKLDDIIIEVENKALTHRPDAFGMIGIARELAGIQQLKFSSPDWLFDQNSLPADSPLPLTIDNQEPELCHRLTAVVMSNVNVGNAPLQLQCFLWRLGIKPINNVVDISNYLMVVSGHPSHSFDYDKVAKLSSGDAALVVRKPQDGEKLTILDGREIKPAADSLMICTDTTPLDIAGAIGGTESEIDSETKRIIVTVGAWNLYNLRKTSMHHGIFTDAVTRNIRGQDPAMCAPVSAQSVRMLQDLTGASVSSEFIDSYPEPRQERRILVQAERVNSLLGTSLTAEEMSKILNNVELEVSLQDHELAVVTPTWRPDLAIAEDIAEEIGRLHGYANIKVTLPSRSIRAVDTDPLARLKRQLRQQMVAAGANELLTYSFVSEDLLTKASQDVASAYRIRNALRPELQRMRPNLLPSLLAEVHPNMKRRYGTFSLFEIGKSHTKALVEDGLPSEQHGLSFVWASEKSTNGAAFYQAKAYLSHIFKGSKLQYKPIEEVSGPYLSSVAAMFAPSRSAVVVCDNQPVAVVGEIKASVRSKLKLPDQVLAFEVDLGAVVEVSSDSANYQPLSRFPATSQDVTFAAKQSLTYADLDAAVAAASESICENEELSIEAVPVSIFQAQPNEDKKISMRIRFQHFSRTLTTEEVNNFRQQIIDQVSKTIEVRVDE